jgi:hypothetical protein
MHAGCEYSCERFHESYVELPCSLAISGEVIVLVHMQRPVAENNGTKTGTTFREVTHFNLLQGYTVEGK